jgi:DNA-binding HxlR family transcriptional regulator
MVNLYINGKVNLPVKVADCMDFAMDEYCIKIFGLLGVTTEKFRFNELHRTLSHFGIVMSRPTLIAHLNHLQKKGYIIRKKEAKQNVSYEVNWKKLEYLKESLAYKKEVDQNLKNKATFKSHSLEAQVAIITGILTLQGLFWLKANVLDILEPTKKAEHNLAYVFSSRLLDMYRLWLLDTCKESKENNQKILCSIDELIKDITETFFKITSENKQQKQAKSM